MDAKTSALIPESKTENSKKETVPDNIGDMNKIVSANQAESEPKDVEPISNNSIEIPNQINALQELDQIDDLTSNNCVDTPTQKEAIEELDLMEELIFNNHIETPNGMDAIEDLNQIDEDTSNNHREKHIENVEIEDLNLVEQHVETRDTKTTSKDLDRMDELTPNKRNGIPKRNNALEEFDRIENNDFSGNCDESSKIKNEQKLMNADVCMEFAKKVNTEVKPPNAPTEDNLEKTHDKNCLMDNKDFTLRDNCDDDNSNNGNERDHNVNDIETVNIDIDSIELYLSPLSSDDTKKFDRTAEEVVKIPHSNNNSNTNDGGDENGIEILQRCSDDSSNNDSSDEDFYGILQSSSSENSNNDNSDEDNFEILERCTDNSKKNDSSDEVHSKVLQPQFKDCNIYASSDEDDIEIAHPNNKNRITDSSDEGDIKTAQSNNANNIIKNIGEDNIKIPKLCKVVICIPQTCDKKVVNDISNKDIIKRPKPPTKKYIANIDQRSDADYDKRILADVRNSFPKPDESLAIHEYFTEPQPQELELKSITDNNFSQRDMDLRRYSKPEDFPNTMKNLRSMATAQQQLDDKIEVDFRRKQLEDPLTLIKLNKFRRNSRHLNTKRLIKLLKKDIKYDEKSRKNKQYRKGEKRNAHKKAECNYLQFLFSLNKIDGYWKKGIDKLFLDLNKRLSLQENCLFHKSLRKYQFIFKDIGNTMVEELKTKIYKDVLKNSYIMPRKLCVNKPKRSNNFLESAVPTKKKYLKSN